MNQTCVDNLNNPADPNAAMPLHVLIVAPETFTITRMVYEIPFRDLSRQALVWRFVSEYYLKLEDLQDVNVLVLYRCIQGSTLSLAHFARLRRIKVIYELDDDLLEPPEDTSWGLRYRTGHLSQIIKMFLAEADLVKAGSPELARRLKERGFLAIYQPYTARICDLTGDPVEPPYRIGYFGSPHHQCDIEMVFPALQAMKELLQEQVKFEFIGCFPNQWQQLKAQIFPYVPDYEIFLKTLSEHRWSIGLAPLRRIPYNEAKSNSKFRDYTAAGVLGVYSDMAPYRDSVTDCQNGWLVKESLEEWFETIKKALFSTQRAIMLQQARKLMQSVFSSEAVARNWLALLRELTTLLPATSPV